VTSRPSFSPIDWCRHLFRAAHPAETILSLGLILLTITNIRVAIASCNARAMALLSSPRDMREII